MRYLISSHVNYFHHTKEPLLKSLSVSGVKPTDIMFVIGGGTQASHTTIDDVEIYGALHNSWDFTAIVEYLERGIRDQWVMLLHDTVIAGPEFAQRSLDFDHALDFIAVDSSGYMNMGTMSKKYMEDNMNFLLSMKNCDKLRAIGCETLLPQLTARRGSYGGVRMDLDNKLYAYENEAARKTVRFEGLDLVKHQRFSKITWSGDLFLC